MVLAISKAKYLLLILFFSFSAMSYALGFGDLKIYSYLSEPLYAEIELTGILDVNTNLLKVNLADAKEFIRAGIDRPYFLTYLSFELLRYEDRLFIEIHSTKPLTAPYLEFLVELSWPDGNLLKEYTVLLDPPPANEKYADRPKGFGQLAEQAASAKAFGSTSVEQQMNIQNGLQQKKENEAILAGVVREGKNKFSDNTFDMVTTPTATTPATITELESAKYNAQRQNFLSEKQKDTAQKNKAKPEGALQNLVVDIEEINTELDATSNSNIYEKNNHKEKIDFGNVIKPVVVTEPVVAKPNNISISTPVEAIAPQQSKGNYLYLGLILSLLLIAAGFAIAIKRGLLNSILTKKNINNEHKEEPLAANTENVDISEENPLNFDEHNDILIDADLDKFKPIEDIDAEQIELASPVETNVIVSEKNADILSGEDLEKFEQEFEKINLDELGVPAQEPVPAAIEPIIKEEPADLLPAAADADLLLVAKVEPTEGPSLYSTFESDLKLSDDGATLLNKDGDDNRINLDDRSSVQIKIDLAKQYISAGDNVSAKELLDEVIDMGNDEEKLEAQILRGSIE